MDALFSNQPLPVCLGFFRPAQLDSAALHLAAGIRRMQNKAAILLCEQAPIEHSALFCAGLNLLKMSSIWDLFLL